MKTILAAVLVVLLGLPAHAQDSLNKGDTISGTLRVVKTRHPSGTLITAYQVVSANPKKLGFKDEFCGDDPPKTFHLVAMDDKAKAAELKRRLGKKVSVVLEDFFCSETAWHVGDAVSFKWRFAEPPKR